MLVEHCSNYGRSWGACQRHRYAVARKINGYISSRFFAILCCSCLWIDPGASVTDVTGAEDSFCRACIRRPR